MSTVATFVHLLSDRRSEAQLVQRQGFRQQNGRVCVTGKERCHARKVLYPQQQQK